MSWMEIGDKLASIVGAAIAVRVFILDRRSKAAEHPHSVRYRVSIAMVIALGVLAFGFFFVPGLPAALKTTAAWAFPALGIATLIIAFRNRPPTLSRPPELGRLAVAQQAEVVHRYQFTGFHAPPLSEIRVRERISTATTPDDDRRILVSADDLLARHAHALILGSAGSGKSTVVAVMVREAARRASAGHSRQMAVACLATDLIDLHLADALATATLRDHGVHISAAMFDRPPMPGGTWQVFVDGVDEVIESSARDRILWRLHGLLGNEVRIHRIIVTSRPLPATELTDLQRPGVEEYELRPFGSADLNQFAQRWFAARLPSDPAEANRKTTLFLNRLAGARLGPVVRVPLLAMLAAMVFEQADSQALPTTRTQLYECFVDRLMNGRHELSLARGALVTALKSRGLAGNKVVDWFDADFDQIVGRLLEALGAATFDDPAANLLTVALDWLDSHAPHPLTTLLPGARQDVEGILRATGLLSPRQGRLSFSHQSFADFFAGRATAHSFDAATWYALAADPAARSRAAFAAAWQPASDHLVQTLLDDHEDAVAAGDMITGGVPVEDHTRQRVVTVLVERLNQDVPAAAECVRVLRELCADLDALAQVTELANDTGNRFWVRAMLGEAIIDVDRAAGVSVLRHVRSAAPSDVQGWVTTVLAERGIAAEATREAMDAPDARAQRPLGRIGRLAFARRAGDPRAGYQQRLAAATRLCADGDAEPLRALLDEPETDLLVRLRAAVVFADHGDNAPLRALARGANLLNGLSSTPWLRFLAIGELIRRDPRGTGELLHKLITDSGQVPLTYGVAVLLARSGDPETLERMTFESVAESSWIQSPAVPLVLGIAAAEALARRGDPGSLRRALSRQPVPAVRTLLLAGLVRLGDDHADKPLHDLLRSRSRSWQHRVHPWERRLDLRGLLARRGDGESLRWLHRRVHPFMAPKRRLAVASTLRRVDEPAGAEALRRIAAGRWQPPRVRVLATERLCAGPEEARAALHTLRGSTQTRLAAAIRLARVHRDYQLANSMLDDPATATRHRKYIVAILTDGLSESWHDKERALLDHGEWKRFGRPDSLTPGFPFPARPRHPLVRITQFQRLAADKNTPSGLRITAAAALLPTAAGIDALSSLAREPDLHARHRRKAIIAIAAWDPGAARPLVAEAVHNQWLPRTPTWQLLIALLDLPQRGEDGVLDSPEFDTIARQILMLLDGAPITQPFHLTHLIRQRPTLDLDFAHGVGLPL